MLQKRTEVSSLNYNIIFDIIFARGIFMEICIKMSNPTERELELIKELSKIESEKLKDEKKYMEDTLFRKMPSMYGDILKDEKD